VGQFRTAGGLALLGGSRLWPQAVCRPKFFFTTYVSADSPRIHGGIRPAPKLGIDTAIVVLAVLAGRRGLNGTTSGASG